MFKSNLNSRNGQYIIKIFNFSEEIKLGQKRVN